MLFGKDIDPFDTRFGAKTVGQQGVQGFPMLASACHGVKPWVFT
jgi:hypothetical protein